MTNLSSFVPPNITQIIDVVRDFGAVGDAVVASDGTVTGTDNTAAFIAAIQAAQPNGGSSVSFGHWIYVPPGRFMVSNVLEWKNATGVWGACIRIIGQHRDVSEVVLKNAATGYGSAGAPKAIFYTAGQNASGGNTGFKNAFHNLTITVGAGNPGAIATDLHISNTGGMKNVRIRSVDPARAGVSGISLTRAWPGPAYFTNVTVEGFNYGVDVGQYQYGVVFEHLTVLNQVVAGVRNSENMVCIRDLVSSQSAGVPAVLNSDADAFTTVLEADLSATAGTSAIDNSIGGFLRLRNIRSAGYTNKLSNKNVGGSVVDAYSPSQLGDLDEFVNGPITTLHPAQRLTSLRLPVMEPPQYCDTNSSEWANVMDYGAVHGTTVDQSSAIQAAMNSGKSTVFFPPGPPGQIIENGAFLVRTPITIPSTVKRILGCMSVIWSGVWPDGNTNVFTVLDGSDPLFIDSIWCTSTSPGDYALTSFTDAVVTSGTNTITSATSNFTSGHIGRAVSDYTNDAVTSIPANTVVTAVPDANTLTLSKNATATGTRSIRTGGNFDPNGGLKGAHWLEHASRRPLIMHEVTFAGGNLGAVFRSGSGLVHMTGCLVSFTQEPGTRVWCRGHNMELPAGRRIVNNGGDLWFLGLKIEKYGTIVKTINGGRTEVEGGYNLPVNPDWSQEPGYECIDAQHSLSFTGFTFQTYHATFAVQVRETKNGVTHDLLHTDTLKRYNGLSDVVPLHIGRLA